jgi:membrane protein
MQSNESENNRRSPNGILLLQFLKNIGKSVLEVWMLYTRRLVPMMAAGVAFYFLLGLVPFLFITLAVSGYLFRRNPDAFANLSTNLQGLLPPGLGEKILAQISSAAANWQTFGVLGLVALFFVSMGLFESIDWGINGAMGARKRVGFLKGRLIFLAYVAGAILFFSVAAVADHVFQIVLTAPALEGLASYLRIPRRMFSMGVFAVFLFILYKTIPVRTPKFYRGIVVAMAIAAIWAYLQKIGTSLTVNITRRHAIYGALAGGTVFLTWMYLLALLILLGATILDVWERAMGKRTQAPDTMDE